MRATPHQYELLPTSRSGGGSSFSSSPSTSSLPFSSSSSSSSSSRVRRVLSRPLLVALVSSICVTTLLLVLVAVVHTAHNNGASSRTTTHSSHTTTSNTALGTSQVIVRKVLRFDLSAYEIDHLATINLTLAYSTGAASSSDWIGVYCLEKSDKKEEAVLPPVPVLEYLDRRDTSGLAVDVHTFGPLVNMRCAALAFKLLASDGSLLAEAPSHVRFRGGAAQPTQLHLAMTDFSSEMRVLWTSGVDVARAMDARVKYGTRKDALDREAVAAWSTYDADEMCGPPATTRSPQFFRDPGLIHDAVMVDLKPSVRYYYQVGQGRAWSDVRDFTLPPAKGVTSNNETPLSLFVFGDLMTATSATRDFRIAGSCGTTMELIEQDLENHPERPRNPEAPVARRDYVALFHVGDLSYAAGKTSVWDQFGALIEPVASRIPYMVSIGNHDFGYLEGRDAKPERAPVHSVFEMDGTHGHDAHGECGVPSEKRFHMPENGNGIWWYSVDIGLTHHTVLSGEHDFARGSPMHEWLVDDLRRVDRTKTPWLIVHLHRPLYCSVAFGGDFTRSLYLRDHLEQVFAQFRVDLVFSGHYHSYERTCPVYDDKCQYGPNGEAHAPVHIMVGSGGANVDTFGYYSVGWSEFARMTYGYGRLHVYNATHAQFEFVENDLRRVSDHMWIISDHEWTRHDDWRWRRVVFHPSLAFSISAALLSVASAVMLVVRHRRKHRLAKRS